MNSHQEHLTGDVMLDQASELRKLVLRSVRQQVNAAGPAPRLIVVAAGKGGVGATTMAVNLSVALAEHGSRVVIVDTDLSASGVASVANLCGLGDAETAGDVLSARRDIHEVLERGPAGIQVVPGLFNSTSERAWGEAAQQRLLRQLNTLGKHADIVVLDAGDGGQGFLQRCCVTADRVLLVTTADRMSVMDTYACIKSSLADLGQQQLGLIINCCSELGVSRDVHERIDQSCRRFLRHEVELIGTIPDDPLVLTAASHAIPFVLASPDAPASRAVTQLAAAILAESPHRKDLATDVA